MDNAFQYTLCAALYKGLIDHSMRGSQAPITRGQRDMSMRTGFAKVRQSIRPLLWGVVSMLCGLALAVMATLDASGFEGYSSMLRNYGLIVTGGSGVLCWALLRSCWAAE